MDKIDFPSYWDELISASQRFKDMGMIMGGTPEDRIAYLQKEIAGLQKRIEDSKLQKDALTAPTPALFYPKLAHYLIERIMPNLQLKPLLQDFFIKVGTTCAIPKQKDTLATAVVGLAANGDKVFMDFTPYNLITITPYNVGLRVRITKETLEDEMVNIVDDQFRQAAKRVIAGVEDDIAQLFDYSTRKPWAWLPGNRYPKLDDVLCDLFDTADRYIVVTNDKVSLHRPAFKTIRSPYIAKDTAYVIQVVYDGCYAPIGYWVTKRPINVDVWPQPAFDSIDIVITARYAPVLVYPEGITRCRV